MLHHENNFSKFDIWLCPLQLSNKIYVSSPNWKPRTPSIDNLLECNLTILPPRTLITSSVSKHDFMGNCLVIKRSLFPDDERTRCQDHITFNPHRMTNTELCGDIVPTACFESCNKQLHRSLYNIHLTNY